MQKTITIKSCEIKKQGTNDKTGKEWTLFKVICEGDDDMKEFSTFNGDYMNADGQQMKSNFEYNSQYKNWQEISAAQEKDNSKHDEIMNALKEIWNKLDETK